jgi:Secretion system C-terminal sorting domain
MSSFYIPKPCHENWKNMTPQEKGRHCDVCSKVVVDFTQKTPVEVDKIMHEAEGSVCGNFNINQLNQEAQMKVFKNPTNLFNRNFKYFAMTVFGFFAFNKKSEAQMKGKVAIRGDVAPYEYENTNKETTTLSGTIKKADGRPAGGAVVVLTSEGNEIGRTTAIANGAYSIKIRPGKIVNKKVNVTVNYSHAETKHVNDLTLNKPENKLNVTLDEMYMMLGEVAFVEPQVVDSVVKVVEPVDTIKTDIVIPIETVTESVIVDTVKTTTCNETYTIEPTDTTNQTNEKTPENLINNLVIRPEDIQASIYPNPAGTFATLYCNKADKYKIELFDLKGALQQTTYMSGTEVRLDVSKLQRGTYIVKVNDVTGVVNTLRLVKN